jgi:predicted phosphodiesterase
VDKVFTWNVLGLHGHQIGNIDNVIPQYSAMLKVLFDLVVMGHWHSPEERESNCAEVIVNGSLVGTNSYSMDRIRQSSIPSQKFFIVDKDEGKTLSYNIRLN